MRPYSKHAPWRQRCASDYGTGASVMIASAWLMEHAPWLWLKPTVRVFVSMKTGEVTLWPPVDQAIASDSKRANKG